MITGDYEQKAHVLMYFRSNAPKVAASWDAVFCTPILGMADFTWLPQMSGKARCIITGEVLLGDQGVHLVAGIFSKCIKYVDPVISPIYEKQVCSARLYAPDPLEFLSRLLLREDIQPKQEGILTH